MAGKREDLMLWSEAKLYNELSTGGIKADHQVNAFLNIRLVHYYAKNGSLAHLKVLHAYGADFKAKTRYGTTAYDELLICWDRTKDESVSKCISWFSQMIPDTPPVTPSITPSSSPADEAYPRSPLSISTQ